MSDNVDALKKQIEELQSQVAFQEDTSHRLDEALAGQQREILLLRRQVELLGERIKAQAGQGGTTQAASAADEKPPHY